MPPAQSYARLDPDAEPEVVSDESTSSRTSTSVHPENTAGSAFASNSHSQHSHPTEGSSSNLAASSQGAASQSLDLERQELASPRQMSAKQRALNVVKYLFPFRQTYDRLGNGLTTGRLQPSTPGRFVGQGTDGVFRNLMAKPDTESDRVGQEQHPPSYETAAADSSPEYWEATMISPMYEDEVFVQGLPVGNLSNFVWNVLVTVAFQLVGFVLCYLLHTSHAAKEGTRAGLGITMIMYGYSTIPANFGRPDRIPTRYEPNDPNSIDISKSSSIKAGGAVDEYSSGFVPHSELSSESSFKAPFFAYGIIALGILVIFKSLADYYKIKQEEKRILGSHMQPEVVHTTTENVYEAPPTE